MQVIGLGPDEYSLRHARIGSANLPVQLIPRSPAGTAHLYQFVLADGRRIGQPEFDEFDDEVFIDGAATTLSTLTLGEQFVYEFDFGDSWTHLCTVGPARIDPATESGINPTEPLPYWGWGTIPDQYGRRWADDDGERAEPPNPGTSDLPPLQPGWGAQPPR